MCRQVTARSFLYCVRLILLPCGALALDWYPHANPRGDMNIILRPGFCVYGSHELSSRCTVCIFATCHLYWLYCDEAGYATLGSERRGYELLKKYIRLQIWPRFNFKILQMCTIHSLLRLTKLDHHTLASTRSTWAICSYKKENKDKQRCAI